MWKFVFLSVIALVACKQNKTSKPTPSTSTLEAVDIKYASNFKLKKNSSGYLLELIDPNTKKIGRTIEILPGKHKKLISLVAPLNGMLSILDAQDVLVGISNIDHIYDPTIKKMFKKGAIESYGDKYQNSTEKIIASGATIVFYDVVDEAYEHQSKLKRFGIEVMPIYDWRENHPLAKAEWIKVVGAITGKMKEANVFFRKIESNYDRLSKIGATYNMQPSVLCGELIGDTWFTPGGTNYFAKIIADAGANYRYKDKKNNASLTLTIEQVLSENKKTDYWLNAGAANKKSILSTNPHAKHLDAFNNHIYCYSPNMKKYWEQSSTRPDLVLSDLIHIFHPEETSIAELYFYQNIK